MFRVLVNYSAYFVVQEVCNDEDFRAGETDRPVALMKS